jgi:hypothetical protein
MIKLLKIPPSFCVLDIGSNDDLRNIEGKQTPHSSEIDNTAFWLAVIRVSDIGTI